MQSDFSTEFFIKEHIREVIFYHLDKEIPYKTDIEIENLNPFGDTTYISIVLKIANTSHKKILIGKRGNNLTRLRIGIDKKLSLYLKTNTKSQLTVKIKKNKTKRTACDD